MSNNKKERRDNKIAIRLNDQEYKMAKKLAHHSQVRVSKYLRDLIIREYEQLYDLTSSRNE